MAQSKIIVAHLSAQAQKASEALARANSCKLVAQSLFPIVAKALGYKCRREVISEYTAVKPVIRELVAQGVVTFHHVEGGTSYYNINTLDLSEGQIFFDTGRIVPNFRIKDEECTHAVANRLLASKPWHINIARLADAEAKLLNGYVFHNFQWCKEPDSERHQEQMEMLAGLKALLEKNPENKFFFTISNDGRGRFYIKGGKIGPHNGKLGRFLWTSEDEKTFDHRTSFAQNFALLTGNPWGKFCGVGSNDPDADFWRGALAPYGVTIKPHSTVREACKAYGMKRFYGAGDDTAEADCLSLLKEAVAKGECTQDTADAVLDALRQFGEILKSFSARTRAYAQSFVDWGDFPHWKTPSGFMSYKDDYYCHVTKTWNSGDNSTCYYPKTMSSVMKTKRICTQPEHESDKSVLVATCANLLQSIDASIMAKVIVSFHEQTGFVLFPIHDSYTVPTHLEDTLKLCVIDAMREVADSPELKAIRTELGLVPVKVLVGRAKPAKDYVNLDLRLMNPLDEE